MASALTLSCSCCNAIVQEHKSVVCCVCKKLFNYLCVDLNATEVRTIKTKRGLTWSCSDCATMGNDIIDLKAAIVALKNEVCELKQQTASFKSAPMDDHSFEEIIQELRDRDRRRCNLIIYGVQENSSSTRTERRAKDDGEIMKVLGHLSIECEASSSRLGIFDITKSTPRPLRVALDNERLVYDVLRKSKKLNDNENFKNIRISSDRTPRQMKYFGRVKKDLLERRASGESDIYIKYINGMPKIVKGKPFLR